MVVYNFQQQATTQEALAINQLELALSVPSISDVQRARYVARLKELREAMPKQRGHSQNPAPPAPCWPRS